MTEERWKAARDAVEQVLPFARAMLEGERAFREDQQLNRDNGWSLLGLKLALEAQGREDEAASIGPKLDAAWRRTDVRPTSSCLCEPGRS